MRKHDQRSSVSYLVVLGVLLSLVMVFGNQPVAHAKQHKNVLYISSYNGNFESVPMQIAGIQSVLEPEEIHLDMEYMDTKRFATKENELLFYDMLKYKMSHLPAYDAIIVGDDAALQFAMDHQKQLFDGVPIVFLGVNNFDRAYVASENSYITGIIEETSLRDNIAIARSINPKATKVVAIVDNTMTGLGDREQFYRAEHEFPELQFDDINAAEYTFDEVGDLVETIGNDTILLYLSMYTDKNGENLTITDASKLLSRHAKVPIYRAEVGGVGIGVFGGKMVNYKESGKIAAQMVLDCFHGTPIESIKTIMTSPNYYVFDYKLIQKFKIDKSLIPDNATYVNKETNIFEENKDLFLSAMLIMALLIVFSVILFIDNIKRRMMEKALKKSNEQLSETYEDLCATEEELRAQYQTIQEHAEKIEDLYIENEFLAQHDYLTNLPNRMNFMNKLKKEIEMNNPGAILLIDLDNFKNINDTLGHTYGDVVLKEVADRLMSISDDKIYVSRFGGDEFLILIANETSKEKIKKYIALIKNKFDIPFTLMSKENYIQFSIGVSRFPYDCLEVNQLVMYADTAMYKAKTLGKNNYIFYADEMLEELRDKSEIEGILRHAIKEEGFMLMYQPQVDVQTGEIDSFEALLRLKYHNIPPDKFIEVAEDTGLIMEIGRWVVKEVVEQLALWKIKGMPMKTVSFNFSSKQLRDTYFLTFLENLLTKNDIDASYVEIEITESSLLASTDNILKFLNQLKKLGLKIALDDFGTGYSSINYLTYIPADKVKLDKSLSDKFLEIENFSVMDSIISLAHSLNFQITAEGIEEYHQYIRLKMGGCDYIQGYFFSKPLGVLDVEKIYEKNLLEIVCFE